MELKIGDQTPLVTSGDQPLSKAGHRRIVVSDQ